MNTIIKKAEKSEHYKIIEILADEIWNECYISIISKEQIEYMLKNFQSENTIKEQSEKGSLYFWAEYDGEYAGYCCIVPENDGVFLSKFYIKKEFRGKGIAKKLLRYALEPFLSQKPLRIHLTVNKYNTNSIAVYKKMGFEIFNECINDIGNGFVMDDFEMECFLEPNSL